MELGADDDRRVDARFFQYERDKRRRRAFSVRSADGDGLVLFRQCSNRFGVRPHFQLSLFCRRVFGIFFLYGGRRDDKRSPLREIVWRVSDCNGNSFFAEVLNNLAFANVGPGNSMPFREVVLRQ